MLPSEWTLQSYTRLCRAVLDSGYRVQGVREFMQSPAERSVVMRHDVDRFPGNALRMAQSERELGLTSTYYVRTVRGVFDPRIIEAIHALGHEVGYHYEVLAKAAGDMRAALRLFGDELAALRRRVPVHTAAAHGSPLSRWNNYDIWTRARPEDFGLVGEAYRDIDYSRVVYFTDTGRSWGATWANLRDRVGAGASRAPQIRTTDELIELVREADLPALCVQTHPERWNDTLAGLTRSVALDLAANGAKWMLRRLRAA